MPCSATCTQSQHGKLHCRRSTRGQQQGKSISWTHRCIQWCFKFAGPCLLHHTMQPFAATPRCSFQVQNIEQNTVKLKKWLKKLERRDQGKTYRARRRCRTKNRPDTRGAISRWCILSKEDKSIGQKHHVRKVLYASAESGTLYAWGNYEDLALQASGKFILSVQV